MPYIDVPVDVFVMLMILAFAAGMLIEAALTLGVNSMRKPRGAR